MYPKTHYTHLGIDLACSRDVSVATVLEKDGQVLRVKKIIRLIRAIRGSKKQNSAPPRLRVSL